MNTTDSPKKINDLPPSRQDSSAGVRVGHAKASDLNFDKWRNPELIRHTKSADRLVNLERAYEVMDRNGLAGIVASTPLNIYYLSSHGGITQWMGRPFTSFAFLPRDENASPALIMPHFNLYHLDYRPTWMPSVQPYSMPLLSEDGQLEWDDEGSLRATQSASIWPVREGSLNKRDHTLLAIFAEYQGKMSANAIYALKKAIVEGGAKGGAVGFDDPRLGHWLKDAGLSEMSTVDATNIFKEIRMVKTSPEVELLRAAAVKNEEALDYAIEQIAPGVPLSEVERAHAQKWGELDGRGKWLIANINGLNSGEVEVGDFMKLDSVGVYRGYHGDVGRTVMVGYPPDELVRRIEADTKCAKVVYDSIRPGMLFSEATSIFISLMKDEGFAAMAAPHNVGLEHTDQPFTALGHIPESVGNDFTFENGTVFTLDMPHNEIGWGTTHVEDMMLVHENGCEALSSMDTSLRIRPA
ncbi:MAG: M24 family metallopeptidase [Rhodospirillaceae bacterium]